MYIRTSTGEYKFLLNFNYNSSGVKKVSGGMMADIFNVSLIQLRCASKLEAAIKGLHAAMISDTGWKSVVDTNISGISLKLYYIGEMFLIGLLPLLICLYIVMKYFLK